MTRLDQKVAIITGAAQGMGATHAKTFIDEGAFVVLTDINEEKGESFAKALGDHALFVKHDVTSAKDWKNVIDTTLDHFKHIDILVNNAGITFNKSLFDLTENDYDKIYKINQLSVFLGIKAVSTVMREQKYGSIINISSLNGLKAGAVGYTDTKFAVRGLTKAAAKELAPFNVRVNSVHPGAIETPMLMQEDTKDAVEQLKNYIPLHRIGKPEEVSQMVVFLASDDATYSTGSEFIIDGGLTF